MTVRKDKYGRWINDKYEEGTDSYYRVGVGKRRKRKKRKRASGSGKRKLSILSFL